MTNYIILSGAEAWSLYNDEPVSVYVNQTHHVICTEESFKKIQDESPDRMDGQDEPNYIKEMVIFNNRLNDLSKRVENIEKQMKEDKKKQFEKLKAELDYAKYGYALLQQAESEG